MATRDIYTTTFDEDVSHPNPTGNKTSCAECGGQIRTDIRETACEDCGLVLEVPQIDHGSTWYTDENGDSSKHVGSPLTPSRHDRGLSSTIGYYRDGSGRSLSTKKQRQLGRLRNQQARAEWATKTTQNLGYGLGEVRRISAVLGLSEEVRDQASMLFRRAQRAGLCVGRSLEAIAAASVYATCRCNGFARSLEEIVETARCESSAVVNAYKTVNVELDLQTLPIVAPQWIPTFATTLDIPDEVRRRALELSRIAMDTKMCNGANPRGVAAACLYLASTESGFGLSQTEIAAVADISTATLRSRRDELLELVDILIEDSEILRG